jgi:hypothetical protein
VLTEAEIDLIEIESDFWGRRLLEVGWEGDEVWIRGRSQK